MKSMLAKLPKKLNFKGVWGKLDAKNVSRDKISKSFTKYLRLTLVFM